MKNNPLDEVVARIRLGDPAGETIELSGRTLCQNVLVTGMVGSGKTTSVIYPILKDAIAHHADDPVRKTGLFVFDSKTDGTTGRVVKWAEECGRAGDVMILREGSEWGYYPFNGVSKLSELEIVAAKITSGFQEIGADNEYWERTTRSGIEAVLAFELLEKGVLDFHPALGLMHEFLLGPNGGSSEVSNRISSFTTNLELIRGSVDEQSFRILDSYKQTLHIWQKLDPKTRGILQTCIGNSLGPLLSPRISPFYPVAGRKPVDVSRIVSEGKIVVLCTNAAANCDIAATLGRLIKADLYRAIQQRSFAQEAPDRLVGLFLDEYPLVATANQPFFGDVQNLQTMREKRAFVVAGTQGYVSMHNSVGIKAWEGLRINLATNFFLRSNEPEVDEHARTLLGLRETEESVRIKVDDLTEGGVGTLSQSSQKVSVEGESWIVRQGALARLDTHEAFYTTADGQRSESPVFIIPVFEEPKGLSESVGHNLLDLAAAIYRNASRSELPNSGLLWNISPETSANAIPSLPLHIGSSQTGINILRLEQEFAAALVAEDAPITRRGDTSRSMRLRKISFVDLLRKLDELASCGQAAIPVVKTASAAVIQYAATFTELSNGGKTVSQAKLAEAATILYRELGVIEIVETVADRVVTVANLDSKMVCELSAPVSLDLIPDHAFGLGTVMFFSTLQHSVFQAALPRMILAAWHKEIPLAVFDPSAITRENSLLVAAAHVSFASCLSPNRYFPSVSA